mgnify:CR=1 FL=1
MPKRKNKSANTQILLSIETVFLSSNGMQLFDYQY